MACYNTILNLSDIDSTARQASETCRKLFRDMPITSKQSEYASPPISIYDVGESYIILVQIPFVKKEDIRIVVTHRYITIISDPKMDAQYTTEEQLCSEIQASPFSYRLLLPKNIDRTKISAKYENNVLKVTFPKTDISCLSRVITVE